MSLHNYNAILIDTSIFDGNGLRLETGLLGKLRQFKETKIDLLLPDVIKNEIQSHLEKKIRASSLSLERAINDAGDHLFFDGSALNEVKKLLIDSNKPEQLAQSRLKKFVNDTGALEIDCTDYVSICEVLDQYFSNKPPFSEVGKNKNEFPDAIILLAAERWAKQKNKLILAISKDKGWKSYCENSPKIHYEDDFAAGLASFNDAIAPFSFVESLTKHLKKDSAQSFITQVEHGLEYTLCNFAAEQNSESQWYYEFTGFESWFKSFSFIDNTFRIIEANQKHLVLEASAKITVGAEGDFSLYTPDLIEDDINFSNMAISTEETFKSAILITISGELTEDIDTIKIEEVEVLDPIRKINFGDLDFDYGEL